MEPRASTPAKRLEALRQLSDAGIPTTVMIAPVIPAINDADIERILDAVALAGVKSAGYVMLRLPLEVRDLFKEWLMANYPDRFRHVMKLVREMRGGKDYDSTWGKRQTGEGPYAWLIGRRFEAACERLGLNKERSEAHHRAFPEADEGQRAAEFVLASSPAKAAIHKHRCGLVPAFAATSEFAMPHAHISLVTLGVTDVPRAARFYEALGFERKMRGAPERRGRVLRCRHRSRFRCMSSAGSPAMPAFAPEPKLPAFRAIVARLELRKRSRGRCRHGARAEGRRNRTGSRKGSRLGRLSRSFRSIRTAISGKSRTIPSFHCRRTGA